MLSAAVPPVATGSTLIDGYPQDFTGAFMTDGQMRASPLALRWCRDDVYYVAATNRYVTTVAAGAVLIPGAFFDTTGANGDIVEISSNIGALNMPQVFEDAQSAFPFVLAQGRNIETRIYTRRYPAFNYAASIPVVTEGAPGHRHHLLHRRYRR